MKMKNAQKGEKALCNDVNRNWWNPIKDFMDLLRKKLVAILLVSGADVTLLKVASFPTRLKVTKLALK